MIIRETVRGPNTALHNSSTEGSPGGLTSTSEYQTEIQRPQDRAAPLSADCFGRVPLGRYNTLFGLGESSTQHQYCRQELSGLQAAGGSTPRPSRWSPRLSRGAHGQPNSISGFPSFPPGPATLCGLPLPLESGPRSTPGSWKTKGCPLASCSCQAHPFASSAVSPPPWSLSTQGLRSQQQR